MKKNAPKFAVPIISFLCAIGFIYVWDYINENFEGRFAGYGEKGLMSEVWLTFLKTPQISLTVISAILLLTVGFAISCRAIGRKAKGSAMLLIMILITAALFAVMFYGLVLGITS